MLGPQRGLYYTHHAYTRPYSGAFYGIRILCVNTRMRIVVTLESDDPRIDEIYSYCNQHSITMFPGRYIVVDDTYWIWRIESDLTKDLLWLLLKYPKYLVSV